MTLLFTVLGVAYAAFAVWLTVRIINRRERWAQRAAVALVGLSALYALSSGPMQSVAFRCHITHMITHETDGSDRVQALSSTDRGIWWPTAYAPLVWASEQKSGEFVNWYWRLFPIQSSFEPP